MINKTYLDLNKELPLQEPEKINLTDRQRILQRLMYHPHSTFNQLWHKEGRSNVFAYHLKTLQKEGLVKKDKDGTYALSNEGKQLVAYFEGNTVTKVQLPLIVAAVVITNGDKFLMIQRDREPFRGHWGFHGGKLKTGEYLLESAEKSVKEETGLECDFQLKGMFSAKTYQEENLAFTHQIFIIKGTNPRGELVERTLKGTNRWMKEKDLKNLQMFPNIPNLLEISKSDRFRWIEADRFQKDEDFMGMKIRRDDLI